MKTNYSKIAETIGISKQALSNIVNGRRRPSWGTAKRIAFATGTDPVLWMDGAPCEIKRAIDLFKHINSKPYLQ
jgi:transcriptional regulator with XRE-family HTH domain